MPAEMKFYWKYPSIIFYASCFYENRDTIFCTLFCDLPFPPSILSQASLLGLHGFLCSIFRNGTCAGLLYGWTMLYFIEICIIRQLCFLVSHCDLVLKGGRSVSAHSYGFPLGNYCRSRTAFFCKLIYFN